MPVLVFSSDTFFAKVRCVWLLSNRCIAVRHVLFGVSLVVIFVVVVVVFVFFFCCSCCYFPLMNKETLRALPIPVTDRVMQDFRYMINKRHKLLNTQGKYSKNTLSCFV